jgi:signal transduction histidine kinase
LVAGRGCLSSDASAAVLEERARIARELHDTVSQTLYAIALGATRARRLLERSEGREAQLIVEDLLQLADSGQTELRGLLTEIRSDPLPTRGLTEALIEVVEDFRTRHALDIGLSFDAEPNVPAATRDALVMIVREALHNVVKHAGASSVEIVLEQPADHLVLMVTDDGRGFDTGRTKAGHFGLQSMRERAAAVGASLQLVSEEGIGTRLRIAFVSKRPM